MQADTAFLPAAFVRAYVVFWLPYFGRYTVTNY